MESYFYDFDELELIPGSMVLASGVADIEYEYSWEGKSVSEIRYKVRDITLYPTAKGGVYRTLKDDHPFYKFLVDALTSKTESERIEWEIKEYIESGLTYGDE